jgi:hypothetical protein
MNRLPVQLVFTIWTFIAAALLVIVALGALL